MLALHFLANFFNPIILLVSEVSEVCVSAICETVCIVVLLLEVLVRSELTEQSEEHMQ